MLKLRADPHRAMIPETFTHSLWHATAAPGPATAPLVGEARCDAAIIGAGLLGLSAALHLAEGGARVIVIERGCIGFGASGRNGGFLVPHFPRIGPSAVARLIGAERGQALSQALNSGADLIAGIAARHRIDCDLRRAGWLMPAHAASRAAALERRAAEWQALRRPVCFLGSAETEAMTGSPQFHGALFDPQGGSLNPLALCRGLARAAISRGAVIHEHSEATELRREAGRWRITTAQGEVRADRVIVATNAAPQSPVRHLAQTAIPLNVYQMATPPLGPDERARALPGGQALSDTSRNLFSCHFDGAGHLITGGMASIQSGAISRLRKPLAARLNTRFPALRPVGFSHAWHGVASVMPDFLPRFFDLGPGGAALTACNGRGIVMAVMLGQRIAQAFQRGDDQLVPLPKQPVAPLRFHAAARHAPALLLLFSKFLDRCD